jgi:hypothetical protein
LFPNVEKLLAVALTVEFSVPPNCAFETDDIEKEWVWSKPFDFIFSRMLGGSLADPQGFIQRAFK